MLSRARSSKRRKTAGLTPADMASSDEVASDEAAQDVPQHARTPDNSTMHIEPTPPQPAKEASTTDPAPPSPPAVAPTIDQTSLRCAWPAERVPVEIFNIMIQSLSRQDIQMMRLVNREFDAKLSEIYFSVVVVPFRPEFDTLYGCLNIKTNADEPSSQAAGDDGVLAAGHRVFQQFGRNMRKFALALEINEKDLAFPPIKLIQEIHTAPWGLYRWPVMNYSRYSQVEGLEQLANETSHMSDAFAYLKQVTEIGISCDAGLGWLHGPDTNGICDRTQPSVFRPTLHQAVDMDTLMEEQDQEVQSHSMHCMSDLKQMACNAGYHPDNWARIILRLLEDEGCDDMIEWTERTLPGGRITRDRVPCFEINEHTTEDDIVRKIKSLIATGDIVLEIARSTGLTPASLTTAQSEMLLELKWAHRALMQSYRLAVMDNRNSFQNLRVLNIARCPSSRVVTWCDDAFWENMTSIETFHLGVIPDWREIRKKANGTIDHLQVAPSEACQMVFRLLHFYVAEQKNIKTLSFEWVCGGEFAMGASQRDRYILPAPVLADKAYMVDTGHAFQPDDVVHLPYVRKLSLKNCWFSPHVFTFFFEHMFLEAVEEVFLESVSLSGPPSMAEQPSIYRGNSTKPTHWPWPLCAGGEPGSWFSLVQGAGGAGVLPPPPAQWTTPAPNVPVTATHHGFVPWAQGPPGVNMPPPGPHAPWAAPPVPMFIPGPLNGQLIPNVPFGQFGPLIPNVQYGLHTGAIAFNQTAPPAGNNGAATRWRSRAWSWPHVLARLRMAPDVISTPVQDSDSVDTTHEVHLKKMEKPFAAKFKGILEDRTDQGRHQVLRLKSCGYALIDALHIDNWKVIPDTAILVSQNGDMVHRLRELDSQMLTSSDSMLAKILNYMPDEEERHLRNAFKVDFGWENVYDPIVTQAALDDGSPQAGEARFSGSVCNKPPRVNGAETLQEPNGALAGSYRF